MNIIGSSSVTQLGSPYSITGPTGNTGPTGSIGLQGIGLTGNTGSSIIGISLVNRSIITYFSDGTTAGATGQIFGATGNLAYLIDGENLGTGLSLYAGICGDNLTLRPIKIVNNSSASTVSVSLVNSNHYEITLQNISQGITVSGGNTGTRNFIKFNSSGVPELVNNTFGVTSSDTSNNNIGVKFSGSNIFEKVRGAGWTGSTAGITCVYSSTGITCTLNPFVREYDSLMGGSRSKFYVINFAGHTGNIQLAPIPLSEAKYAHSFTLILENAKNPRNLNNRFSTNIKWPNNAVPCFSVDGVTQSMRITFFGLGNQWYASPRSLGTNKNIFYSSCSQTSQLAIYSSFVTGACCKSDGSCSEISAFLCDGYFHGVGTTCGANSNEICNKPGSCCKKFNDGTYGVQNLTCKQCLTFNAPGILDTEFAGNYKYLNDSTTCYKLFERIGACCDGKGNCIVTTETQCNENQSFFQGINTTCFDSNNNPICSSGVGGCCINGDCSYNNYNDCFNNDGIYFGSGQSCGNFVCPINTTCLNTIDGITIYPGAYYGGGIVVGIFEPGITDILGAKNLFSPIGKLTSLNGLTFPCSFYKSFEDKTAYGLTKDCDRSEAYMIIVYPYDIAVDNNYRIKSPTQPGYYKNTFPWGGTGIAWGPLNYNGSDYAQIEFTNYLNSHIAFAEGYWTDGLTGVTQLSSSILVNNTYKPCSVLPTTLESELGQIMAQRGPYSLHGNWSGCWGLYNTIRAMSAQLIGSKVSGYEKYKVNSPYIRNAFTITRRLNDGITSISQGITQNNYALSPWYVPSHDEMAFIAANTTSSFGGFNVNHKLIDVGEPINGKYWTSTGTFNYKNNEGVYNLSNTLNAGVNPAPGSVAITMNIDANGIINNYKVYKESRINLNKVRPIRMLRCDGRKTQDNRFWIVPQIYLPSNKEPPLLPQAIFPDTTIDIII